MIDVAILRRHETHLINPTYQMAKRVMDLIICLTLLPVLGPILCLVGLIVILDSSGPALFKQTRIGKDGQKFDIYKFRTMQHKFDDTAHRAFMKSYINGQVNEENNAPSTSYKPPSQKQITRIGKFLRKSSIDELPQLINVMRGEMTLVGPRPNVPWEVEEYEPWHAERLEVKPGITGLAQVKGRSNIPFDKLVEYDVAYVQNQSVWLDIKICWLTLFAIIKKDGAS